MNITKLVNGMSYFLGAKDATDENWYKAIVQPIIDLLDKLLLPILIVLGTAGSIYVIILGVNYSKAETSDKREEAKKRMINAVIGIVVMIVLLVLLKLFTTYADQIVGFVNETVSNVSISSN